MATDHSNTPEDFTLYDRCITRGIVGSVLPVIYGNGNRILQTPGQVVITYEMIHDTRIIPLDGRPHLGRHINQYLGDSRGHWEGNTLVVETTNLTDRDQHWRERQRAASQRRDEAHRTVHSHGVRRHPGYEVTMEDPKTYARPWKISPAADVSIRVLPAAV